MIVEYFRPKNIDETLELIANPKTKTVLMGGGTALDRSTTEPYAVVDLQDVGLNILHSKGRTLEIGATVTLQTLFEHPQIPGALKNAIYREVALNLRQVATIAGTLVASSGRSPFTTAMLALDASVSLNPGDENITLGDLLPLRDKELDAKLISKITIPLNVQLAYEYVARTPADLPIVCAAVAMWPSGRTRVILGGSGEAPILAMDGPERGGEEISAENAYSHAEDQWASAGYRQELAQVLVRRCLARLDA
jgi:CO/xanthine dehydrogenase FAD-binding subunit